MAKQSGLGWTTCSVDDAAGVVRTIINDVTNLQFATPRGVQDITGIDKSAYERLLLLADFSITLNIVANFAGEPVPRRVQDGPVDVGEPDHDPHRGREDPRERGAVHGLPAPAVQQR
jgi:hypothetical protein